MDPSEICQRQAKEYAISFGLTKSIVYRDRFWSRFHALQETPIKSTFS
jgi:hypothetical protein